MPALRGCDGCTACCTVLNVPPVDSPAFQPCRHLCAAGCGIYGSRPGVCREFYCEWALGHAPEWMKPDVCGVVPGHTEGKTAIHLHEVWPDAAASDQVRTFIRLANSKNIHVVVTLHPGKALGDKPLAQRNRIYLANGELREFNGLHFSAAILVVTQNRVSGRDAGSEILPSSAIRPSR